MTGDNELFYQWAVKMAEDIKLNGLSSWSLFPQNAAGINVSLASLFFVLFGNSISIIAPWNAFIHVLSAYCLYHILLQFDFSAKKSFLVAVIFVFFPTTLLWISQLHKDLYSNLSWFSLILALTLAFKKGEIIKPLLLSLVASITLVSVRPMYLNLAIIVLCCSFLLNFVIKKKSFAQAKSISLSYLAIGFPILISLIVFYRGGIKNTYSEDYFFSTSHTSCNPQNWTPTTYVPSFLDNKIKMLAFTRKRQICYMDPTATSNLNLKFFPEKSSDILKNIPYSFYIGIFQPTPSFLLSLKKSSAYAIIPEMLIYYISLFFLFLSFIKRPDRSIIHLFLICCMAIIILTITTPNIGTLHRVRFPFFFLIFSIGISYLLENKKLSRMLSNEIKHEHDK